MLFIGTQFIKKQTSKPKWIRDTIVIHFSKDTVVGNKGSAGLTFRTILYDVGPLGYVLKPADTEGEAGAKKQRTRGQRTHNEYSESNKCTGQAVMNRQTGEPILPARTAINRQPVNQFYRREPRTNAWPDIGSRFSPVKLVPRFGQILVLRW